jgi:hypothetical protein
LELTHPPPRCRIMVVDCNSLGNLSDAVTSTDLGKQLPCR